MTKPVRTQDERTKAEVTTDANVVKAKFTTGVTALTVQDKAAGKPRKIKVELDNGRILVIDAVDNWQAKLERTISKFINKV